MGDAGMPEAVRDAGRAAFQRALDTSATSWIGHAEDASTAAGYAAALAASSPKEGGGGAYTLRCADGRVHREHGEAPTADNEPCAREAAEFMDEARPDSPWQCGPHTVAPPAGVQVDREALAAAISAAAKDERVGAATGTPTYWLRFAAALAPLLGSPGETP